MADHPKNGVRKVVVSLNVTEVDFMYVCMYTYSKHIIIFWDRLDFIASWSQGHINECKTYNLYGLALYQKRQQKMKVN